MIVEPFTLVTVNVLHCPFAPTVFVPCWSCGGPLWETASVWKLLVPLDSRPWALVAPVDKPTPTVNMKAKTRTRLPSRSRLRLCEREAGAWLKQVDAASSSFFFFQAEDGIRDHCVTGVQTCALPI